jgi:outer membrane protein assembly factor BamB
VCAALVLLLAAGGCGGGKKPTSTSTQGSAPSSKPGPRLWPLRVTVLDGDTDRPIAGAKVSVPGTKRRGPALFLRTRAANPTVTVRAPHYATRTVQVAAGRGARNVTVDLYQPDGQWLMYGISPSRTQVQPAIRLRPPFRVVWGRNLHTLVEYPAVVDDGVAYVSNLHGELYALSMDDGSTLWQFDMQTREEDSSPAVVGGRLVAHAKNGRVLVLDRATGKLLWSWQASGEIESSPVVLDGIDYLADWAGDVYALDLHTHRLVWTYHDGCKMTASVAISGRALYLGDYCGRAFSLSVASGKLLWSSNTGGAVYGTSATAGGRVFVPSRGSEALYAYTTGGQYLWHVSTGGLVYSAPAVWRGRVYFGSYTGLLYCVSAATGAVLWTLQTGGEISGSPTIVDGVVYAGTFSHRIVGADARTGRQLFTFPHGEYVAVSGNSGRLLLFGWASVWAVEPKR